MLPFNTSPFENNNQVSVPLLLSYMIEVKNI